MGPEQGYNPELPTNEKVEVREMPEAESSIDRLPGILGFVETSELGQLRAALVDVPRGGEKATELLTRYQVLAEAAVDQLDRMERASARIGLIVKMGLMRRAGGQEEASYEDFKGAYTDASNMGTVVAEEILTEPLLDFAMAGAQALGLDGEDLIAAMYAEAADLGIPDPEGYLRAKGLLGE